MAPKLKTSKRALTEVLTGIVRRHKDELRHIGFRSDVTDDQRELLAYQANTMLEAKLREFVDTLDQVVIE